MTSQEYIFAKTLKTPSFSHVGGGGKHEQTGKNQQINNKYLHFKSKCGIFVNMSTEVTNIRLDRELKKEATELFNDLGLTLSQAFTVFLKQSLLHHGLPFAVTRPPSKELLAAIDEGEKTAHDPNAKTYSTPQELWDELGI